MKYFIYIILLYIFLPFNFSIDLITTLVFFVIFNEDERFTLVFAFLAGLLVDLYNPVKLGANVLVYLILAQALLYLKKYIAQSLLAIVATFSIFYLLKIIVIHLALSSPLKIQPTIITIITFLPIFWVLNKLLYRVWMRI